MAMCAAFAGGATRGALSRVSRMVPARANAQPIHTDLAGFSPAPIANAGVSNAVSCTREKLSCAAGSVQQAFVCSSEVI